MYLRLLRGAFVAALSASFVLMAPSPAAAQWQPAITWNTFLGGGTLPDGGADTNRDDRIEGVARTLDGDVVVTGWTNARTFPATPADAGLPTASASKRDVFVARFSADGQTLKWARVFGGNEDDVGTAVAVTTSGAVFVVGRTSSAIINIAPNVQAPLSTRYSRQGRVDAFLARLEPDGVLDYFMFLGSALDDEAEDLALGPDGNVAYIVGKTGRDDGPFDSDKSDDSDVPFPPNNPLSNERLRAFEVFVSQVDVASPGDPVVRWTRILTSSENDIAYSVAVQGDAVYVGGIIGDVFKGESTIPVRANFARGDNDGFVARLESDAGVSWFRHVGGNGDDDVRGVLSRPDGGIAVVGFTNSEVSAPVPRRPDPDDDVFVLRLDGSGFPVGGGIPVGANGDERPGVAAMDRYGNIYIGGTTTSFDGFVVNAFDAIFEGGPGGSDGFIAMVDSAVEGVIWSSYVGGASSEAEWVRGIAPGPSGEFTLGGYSNAVTWSTSGSGYSSVGYDRTVNGGFDGFLIRGVVDTTPPGQGTVNARLTQDGLLIADWSGFADPETPVTYEWGIGVVPEGVEARPYTYVHRATSVSIPASQLPHEGPFYVTVRATNAVGLPVVASSSPFVGPPRPDAGADGGSADGGASDGGTSDGGSSDGGTSDGGADAGSGDAGSDDEDEGGNRPPLGWACASGGGAGSLGLTGLLVMVALLSMRRGGSRVQARGATGARR